jgi:hypothetical protein
MAMREQIKRFAYAELDQAHLRLDDIEPIIVELANHPLISVQDTYRSFEQRPVYHLQIGQGPDNILLWSQMHGDEPTATASVLDLLNLLAHAPECLPNAFWKRYSVHIVPMLNPDGAQRNTRKNAQGLDINRDGLALQTPEGQILARLVDRLTPTVCFNLHDQNDYYGAGLRGQPATLAFLAPSSDAAKTITEARKTAMQLIVTMQTMIDLELPQQIGRFDDTFYMRSFGDTCMAKGYPTILVEAGKQFNDPHRQCARELISVCLLTAFIALADNSYHDIALDAYFAIPQNHEDTWVDVVFSGITVTHSDGSFCVDVAVNDKNGHVSIKDIGDCQHVHAFTRYHCSQWHITMSELQALYVDGPATFCLQREEQSLFVKDGVMLNPPAAFQLPSQD